jgi:hypothetical protein
LNPVVAHKLETAWFPIKPLRLKSEKTGFNFSSLCFRMGQLVPPTPRFNFHDFPRKTNQADVANAAVTAVGSCTSCCNPVDLYSLKAACFGDSAFEPMKCDILVSSLCFSRIQLVPLYTSEARESGRSAARNAGKDEAKKTGAAAGENNTKKFNIAGGSSAAKSQKTRETRSGKTAAAAAPRLTRAAAASAEGHDEGAAEDGGHARDGHARDGHGGHGHRWGCTS